MDFSLQVELEGKVSGICKAPPRHTLLLLGMERGSARMQPEPWNQMTSWLKGSKASETLLTGRQLGFLSWVWKFQWDICVTKQVQPSSHHGKATRSLESQITDSLLAATGASTLTILQAFFPSFGEDRSLRQRLRTNTFSLSSFLQTFPITYTLVWKAQILTDLSLCYLLISSQLVAHDISHCVLHPAAAIRAEKNS